MNRYDLTNLEDETDTLPFHPGELLASKASAPDELALDESLYELTVEPVRDLSAREEGLPYVDEAPTGVCDPSMMARLRTQACAADERG